MAYDGWLTLRGEEFINLSRTAQLAEVMGIDVVWTDPDSVEWLQNALAPGEDYTDVSTAPWFDEGYPPSAEFAGILPLSIPALDDSTKESSTVEYITSGGSSNRARNRTLPIVANVMIIASTDRGADYGKRWMDRMISGTSEGGACAGSVMEYFRWVQADGQPVPDKAHRRNVTLTRASTVTRKYRSDCASAWTTTFTLTANDPFEYGDEQLMFTDLGGAVTGPDDRIVASGSIALVEDPCPVYDYSPIYDPLYPALVPAPTAPDFYPEGWDLIPGVTFDRNWVEIAPVEPTSLNVVPVLTLRSGADARLVRVSIWGSDADPTDQCDPLWSAIVSYLPAAYDFVIDGEQEASFVWDGFSPLVRRADSLTYSTGARPLRWETFNGNSGLLITLDTLSESGDFYDAGGTVRADLSFVPKSD